MQRVVNFYLTVIVMRTGTAVKIVFVVHAAVVMNVGMKIE